MLREQHFERTKELRLIALKLDQKRAAGTKKRFFKVRHCLPAPCCWSAWCVDSMPYGHFTSATLGSGGSAKVCTEVCLVCMFQQLQGQSAVGRKDRDGKPFQHKH
uniref:Uncharacterized protein n=1 Tax=Eutreptiella gymnastica TaxID=73025 RepID=A0A7S1HU72_9EUGL